MKNKELCYCLSESYNRDSCLCWAYSVGALLRKGHGLWPYALLCWFSSSAFWKGADYLLRKIIPGSSAFPTACPGIPGAPQWWFPRRKANLGALGSCRRSSCSKVWLSVRSYNVTIPLMGNMHRDKLDCFHYSRSSMCLVATITKTHKYNKVN